MGGSALCRFLKLVAADGVLSVGGGGPEEGQSGQEVLQGRKNQTVAGRRDIPARPWQHGPATAVWRGGFTALQHAPPPADLPIPPRMSPQFPTRHAPPSVGTQRTLASCRSSLQCDTPRATTEPIFEPSSDWPRV